MEMWDGYGSGELPNGLKTKEVVQHQIYKDLKGRYLKVIEFREAFNQLHHYITYTDSINHATRFPLNHKLDFKEYSNIGIDSIINSFTPLTIQITTEIDIVVIK
ncbi:hypothetical protein FDH01_gp214 [Acinetobacter phage vB_AbaM_ME3]|uniref:Uncharacterized protein n=1 Tax=Acinetobacter phage vB_AbaM_ME3 TaxID=1837876 RepID=A0A172Q0L8_9CAUD|nr:hypothetical protein FDH01_gp214 [Acinetobacter phage vB_AbaM_ME3]AND75408.1 hypothetical protein ME3_247 [Acinetobacter phage vB_AbaM_ME3]